MEYSIKNLKRIVANRMASNRLSRHVNSLNRLKLANGVSTSKYVDKALATAEKNLQEAKDKSTIDYLRYLNAKDTVLKRKLHGKLPKPEQLAKLEIAAAKVGRSKDAEKLAAKTIERTVDSKGRSVIYDPSKRGTWDSDGKVREMLDKKEKEKDELANLKGALKLIKSAGE